LSSRSRKRSRGIASSSGPINPGALELTVTEFYFSETKVVYEANDVTVTSFPVIHALNGAVGHRFDFAGLAFVHSGDTRAGWPLVRAWTADVTVAGKNVTLEVARALLGDPDQVAVQAAAGREYTEENAAGGGRRGAGVGPVPVRVGGQGAPSWLWPLIGSGVAVGFALAAFALLKARHSGRATGSR
jgi:hypothetical protein